MKITDQNIQDIITALKSGVDLESACHFSGISLNQMYKWLEIGKSIAEIRKPKNDEEKFALDLWLELKKARGQAIVRNVAHIQKAAQSGDWRAAAWWLERTVPNNYGKNIKEISISETKELEN